MIIIGAVNKALWDIDWNVEEMLPHNIIPFLESHAKIKGISAGYLVSPLLGAVAHAMGAAKVVVNEGTHTESALIPLLVVVVMDGIKNLEVLDI